MGGVLTLLACISMSWFLTTQNESNLQKLGASDYAVLTTSLGSVRELVPLVLGFIYAFLGPITTIYIDSTKLRYQDIPTRDKRAILCKCIFKAKIISLPILFLIGSVSSVLIAQNVTRSEIGLYIAVRAIEFSDVSIGFLKSISFTLCNIFSLGLLIKLLRRNLWLNMLVGFLIFVMSQCLVVMMSMFWN